MIGALVVGILLGIIFFGGLWFTVRKMVASKIPALWILFSFIFRMAITLLGFYFISMGDWKKLISCLIGFVVARSIVIHYTKTIDGREMQLKKEVNHEA